MELTGLSEYQVEACVEGLAALMHGETRTAFELAAKSMETNSEVVVASPMDSLGEIISSWNIGVQTKLLPYLKNVFTTAGKTVAAPLGVEAPLDVSSAQVIDGMETSLRAYANDLYDAGQGAVMIGWQDGETVGVMAAQLEAVPKQKEKKAHSIAQTLVSGAVNGGEWEQLLAISAKYDAITTKEWVATHDSHTRPTHEAADGQVVGLGDKFSVGNALLDFPGDPFGDLDEIINCRCTTKYDAEIQAANSSPQTSPDALSADSAVDTTEPILASAVTNSNWDSADHPRGKNGRFIKKGTGSFGALTGLTKNGKNFSNWTKSDQKDFLNEVNSIDQKQWNNLTDDQKLDIEQAVADAVDEDVSGSSDTQMHIDKLGGDDVTSVFQQEDDVDLFDPSTPLPSNVVNDIDTTYGNGDISKEQKEQLLSLENQGVSDDDLQELLDEMVVENKKIASEKYVTPPPSTPKQVVENEIYDAHDMGQISEAEQEVLLKILDNAGSDAAKNFLTELVDQNHATQTANNNALNNPTTPAAPITTGTPPKSVKITHGLIHAKHAPGTVIAEDEKGNRIVWNGSSYDIIDKNGDVVAKDIKKSKLYALLNDFNSDAQWHEPSGKQETEVSLAAPLDAAPPANPIPHPIDDPIDNLINTHANTPIVITEMTAVDDALDDAFGPLNTGLASPLDDDDDIMQPAEIELLLDGELVSHSEVVTGVNALEQEQWDALSPGDQAAVEAAMNEAWGKAAGAGDAKAHLAKLKSAGVNPPAVVTAPALDTTSTSNVGAPVDPLSLGELPNDSQAGILSSLAKLHAVGAISDKDYTDLTTGVKNGKLFMGKMVVGMHNSKVKAANYVVPPPASTLISNPDFDTAMPNGTPVSPLQIITGLGDFAHGEVIAHGEDPYGGAWSVAPGPDGTVLVQMDGQPHAIPHTYPEFVQLTNQSSISWDSYDGSTSIFPAPPSVAKKAPAKNVTPGVGAAYTAKKTASAAPAHVTPPVTSTSSAPPTAAVPVLASDVSHATGAALYKHFKAENVSPAWSGAKIYKSMLAAKAKMAGDPKIAAMSDDELLKLLDKHHNLAKATSGTPYSTKTKEWLKTPAGKKAFAELNPNVATPPSGVAKKMSAKVTGKKVGKVAAKKAAAPNITATEALGDTGVPGHLTPAQRAQVYSDFKSGAYGTYLNDSKPDEIFANATAIGKQHGLTPGQVLAIIDEEGAKKFGVPNAKSFEGKVTEWADKPTSTEAIGQVQAGTWKKAVPAVKKSSYGGYGGGYSSPSYTHAASTPLNEKVPDISDTVPPFDPNLTSADFPVISTSQAATLWNDMITQSGQPFQPKQKASLRHYTTNTGFTNMNTYLRGQNGATDATQTHVNNAQAGMRPTTRNIVLHRGQGSFTDGTGRHWGSYEEISKYVGTNLHQQAFFSSSVGGHAAFGGSIKMEIEVPAGTPAAYVKAFSAYGGEDEMLLAADLEYRVLEVKKQGYQTVVRMRVVPKGQA